MHKLRISMSLPLAMLLIFDAQAARNDAGFDEPLLGSRLEQQTAGGSVPPLGVALPVPALAEEQHYIVEPAGEFDEAAAAAVISQFSNAYRRAGTPRMAVYFNRELSDEVREWVPGTHHKVTAAHNQSASYSGMTGAASAQHSATATIESQSRHPVADSGKRPDMHESWHWQFEDSITTLLLDGGANVVDRAVIFRQMARQAPQTAGMDGSMSSTLNEMSALDKFADVLIEMKVTRSATDFGYDFRAVAKSIESGRVLGTAFVNGNQLQHAGTAVASASGYALRSNPYLTLEQVSRELTIKLMKSLSSQWGG